MNTKFLLSVLELAEKHCGSDFARKLLKIRSDRERILNNIWKSEPLPEKLTPFQKETVLRDIDFDTIIYHAAKYLDKSSLNVLLYDIAEIAMNHGEFRRAKTLLNNILNGKTRNSRLETANILKKIGNIEIYFNNFKAAQKLFKRSLDIYTQIDDKEGIVSVNNYIGATLVEEGKLYQGEIHFIKARKTADELGISQMLAKINMNLGIVYNMRGLFNDAIVCYNKSLQLNNGDKNLLSNLYHNLAITYMFLKQFDVSTKHLDKALSIAQVNNNKYRKGLIYLTQAEVKISKGNFSAATALVTSAFAIFTETGDHLSRGEAYKILGMINREQQNFDVALSYFENSKKIAKNPIDCAEILIELAKLYLLMGESVQAKKSLKDAIKYYTKTGADARIKLVQEAFSDLL